MAFKLELLNTIKLVQDTRVLHVALQMWTKVKLSFVFKCQSSVSDSTNAVDKLTLSPRNLEIIHCKVKIS
ncbi:jg7255 [Pararge aegeria aegeria]|uniref:Jg7255 protein n=1 Tax=Pararge aegeria aegeria TaxID=348720 RepID=A0A8S4SC77_9NEOP|nr:jg7255 [Pararge aegeria aegeria]